MEKRIIFKKGEQREFLNSVKTNLNCTSIRGLLQFGFDIPYSTLKNYYNEHMSLPKSLFDNLCHIAKINPQDLDINYFESNWGQIEGGKKGIRVTMKKYPREIKKWRTLGMENSPVIGDSNLKKIKEPKLNEKLAEFIGAYLGDGTINKYQIRIAGDYRYDLEYHKYLSELIFELFGIKTSMQKDKGHNTLITVISSKNLCSFFNKNFNITYGDKIRNKTIIPQQIMNNKKFFIACLRGLIDTDGSISRRGRGGSQFCIQFCSHNPFLLNQVYNFGRELGIFTFHDKTGAGTNKWSNIEKYFKIVGSSNLRHIVRFYLRKYENKTIYQKEIPIYAEQDLYRNMSLPFKI
ncbi:MAG: LAGLIDADG family homing endonuclease [Nanoarchaeota archaeon]